MKSIIMLIVGIFVAGAALTLFVGITSSQPALTRSKSVFQQSEKSLKKNLVCMVNDTYMKKEQILVEVDNKKYYGCCQMCVETITNKRETRYANDPLTGNEVDKALAFIALNPESTAGKVLYFANVENYQKYLQSLN